MKKAVRFCVSVGFLILWCIFIIHMTNVTVILQRKSTTVIKHTVTSLINHSHQTTKSLRNLTQRLVVELRRFRMDAFGRPRTELDTLGLNDTSDDILDLETPPTSNPAMNGTKKVRLFIPKIIHQTFSSEAVPRVYADCIRSCLLANPDWRYMFWSDKDARNFIRDKYPAHLRLFDKYNNKLLKADAMRYFVLDYYGGLYMDMDVHCLRPIETLLAEKRLVLAPEPHVQSFLLYKKFSIVTNAIMAAEPSHPFLWYVIDQLQRFQRNTSIDNAIYITGPNMLQKVLEDYRSRIPCLESRCKVFVADPTELMPTVDIFNFRKVKNFIRDCMRKTKFVTFDELKTCYWVKLKKYDGKLTSKAYTNHLWKHIGYKPHRAHGKKESIKEIVGTWRKIERYASET